jgi:hypothetical protein
MARDNFDSPILDSYWTALTVGSGSVSIASSLLSISTSGGSPAAVNHQNPGKTWEFKTRIRASASGTFTISLFSDGYTGVAQTWGDMQPIGQVLIGLHIGGVPQWGVYYWDTLSVLQGLDGGGYEPTVLGTWYKLIIIKSTDNFTFSLYTDGDVLFSTHVLPISSVQNGSDRGWISIGSTRTDDPIVDITDLDWIESLYIPVTGGAEDFTTYTKFDPSIQLAVIPNDVEQIGGYTNNPAYIYKDMGVDYFGADFEHHFTMVLSSINYGPGGDCWTSHWCIANSVNSMYGLLTGPDPYIYISAYGGYDYGPPWNPSIFNWTFTMYDGINFQSTPYINYNGTYYVTIKRVGSTSITAYFYSDYDRTVLINSLTIVCRSNNFRYIYPFNNWGHNDHFTGNTNETRNLELAVPVPPSTFQPRSGVALGGTFIY